MMPSQLLTSESTVGTGGQSQFQWLRERTLPNSNYACPQNFDGDTPCYTSIYAIGKQVFVPKIFVF
jgi:hypothetical protein